MTYDRNMVFRITVFGVPVVAVAGLVLLLNSLGASPGIAVAAYAVVAVSTGATIGYFADRLLGPSPNRKHTSAASSDRGY